MRKPSVHKAPHVPPRFSQGRVAWAKMRVERAKKPHIMFDKGARRWLCIYPKNPWYDFFGVIDGRSQSACRFVVELNSPLISKATKFKGTRK